MKILNLGPEVFNLLTNKSDTAVLSERPVGYLANVVKFEYLYKEWGSLEPYTRPALSHFDKDAWFIRTSNNGVIYFDYFDDEIPVAKDLNILYMGMIDNKNLHLCSDVTIFIKPCDIGKVKIIACGEIFTKTPRNKTIDKFGRHYAHAFAIVPKTAYFANVDKMYSGTSGLEIKKYDVTKRMALTFQDILFKEGISW